MAAIVPEALSIERVRAAVEHPAAGAVDIFVGTVRDHDGGREGVSLLEYSAHPDAVATLREVVGEVLATPGVLGAAAEHRVGALHVGDLAVVCAVSAAHRAEAFTACATLIEQLKARVPIWKRQHFADGATEWVGL